MGRAASRRKRQQQDGGGVAASRPNEPGGTDLSERLRRGALAALAATAFLGPVAFLPELLQPGWYAKAAVVVVGSLAALAAWLGSLWAGERLVARIPITLPLLLFVAWAALSPTWATNPHEAVRLVTVWIAAAAAFVTASQAARTSADLSPVFAAAFWSGAAVAVLGFFGPPLGMEALAQRHRLGSTFVNQNPAGHHVAMTMSFGLLLLLERPTGLGAWLRAAALGAMAAFVIHTGAKAAWLALIAQAVLLATVLLLRRRRLSWSRPVGLARPASLALAIALLLAFNPALSRGTASVQSELDEVFVPTGSLISRLAIWRNTVAMIRARPLCGVGAGNFPFVFPRFEDTVVQNPLSGPGKTAGMAHEDYLQVTAELGFVGLALLAAVAVAAAGQALGLLRASDRPLPWTALASLLVLASFAVIAAVDFPLYFATPPLLAALALAGLALGRAEVDDRIGKDRIGPLPASLVVTTCVAATLLVPWSIVIAGRQIRGDHEVWVADGAARRSRWDLALGAAGEALAADPGRPDAQLIQGRALRHLGRYREGAEVLEAALATNPNEYGIYAQLGSCLRYLKEYDRALEVFDRGKRLRPEWPAAHAGLGLTLLDLGRIAEAAAEFERAQRFEPDPVERAKHTFNLAVTLQRQADDRTARDTYVRALEEGLDGNLRAQATLNAGILSQQLGDGDAAERYLGESAAVDPSGQAHFRLGDRRREEGRPREAAAHFEAVLALGAKRSPGELDRLALLRLGNLYQQLEDWPAAKRAWEGALAIDPASAPARRGLALAERGLAAAR